MEIIRVRLINSQNNETKGCEKAPVEILKALKSISSSENQKLIEFEKLKLEEIHVDLENLDEADHLIYTNSLESLEKNFKTFFLGGDHSISYPILRAFNKIEENPFLIVFDAHADCQIAGKNPTNRQWLRKLIETGFDPGKIILIANRNFSSEELVFIKKNKINLIKMDILREDMEGVCDLIMERARSASGFYISIDIDAIDPSCAPATADIEAGGLGSRDIIYFIKRLVLLENFRAADIVEINPEKDFNEITVKLGAKLLAELIC